MGNFCCSSMKFERLNSQYLLSSLFTLDSTENHRITFLNLRSQDINKNNHQWKLLFLLFIISHSHENLVTSSATCLKLLFLLAPIWWFGERLLYLPSVRLLVQWNMGRRQFSGEFFFFSITRGVRANSWPPLSLIAHSLERRHVSGLLQGPFDYKN